MNNFSKNLSKTRIIFFLPFLVFVLTFLIYPLLNTAYLSFLSPTGDFVGLSTYSTVLLSKDIINLSGFPKGPPLGALAHNIIWILIHLPLSIFFGLMFAVLLKEVRGGTVIKLIVFLGMVVPMVVAGILTRFIFDGNVGIVPKFFSLLGFQNLSKSWFAHPETALFACILGSVWMWTGFPMIVYSAGLANIPKEYHEAASIDGASFFQTFFHITLPLLKPATVVVLFMTILGELKMFDLVYVATHGGPGGASNVLALQAWVYAFEALDFNRAAATATFLTILMLIASILLVRYMTKK